MKEELTRADKRALVKMWLFIGALLVGLVGAAIISTSGDLFRLSKLTKENFLEVKSGMFHADVRLILGPPTETKTNRVGPPEEWLYREGGKTVNIFFDEGGRVCNKDQAGL